MDTNPRSTDDDGPRRKDRRGPFTTRLTRRAALAATAGAGIGAGLDRLLARGSPGAGRAAPEDGVVPFYGEHQAGIATPAQAQLYFTAFDLVRPSLNGLRGLLERWTAAGAALTSGRGWQGAHPSLADAPPDPGETAGLPPARLTLTLGVGPGLFGHGGLAGSLAGKRPSALQALPPFPGDQLDVADSGGDLCVQACAEDPQVAFHAVHLLSLLAAPVAVPRWSQAGFRGHILHGGALSAPRNLIGFKDGINNIGPDDAEALRHFVWVAPGDGPDWMAGGTYLVARRIEIQFPSWDELSLARQEQTIGRHKLSGAPLSVIPPHAHIRQAAPAGNRGRQILRRSFNYAPGSDRSAPADGGQLHGGLFFIAFARDPGGQFVPLQQRLATEDALSAFTLHTASAVFACPPGGRPGRFVGEGLFA